MQPLLLPHLLALQMKYPYSDRKLGRCQMVIQHTLEGGLYRAVAVNSEGLIAVTDWCCIHLVSKEGALVRSIGEEEFGGWLFGVAFDLNGDIWVTDWSSNIVFKLSQDGRLLQTVRHARGICFSHPCGLSVSPEGLIYICDWGNHRVTVHDAEGMFLFKFGSQGSGSGCFSGPRDVTFGSDGLVYVLDSGNRRVCVWSKEGAFQRHFKTKHAPTCIAATSYHLVITSANSHSVMVYTLRGQLAYKFGGKGSDLGRFNGPFGVCVEDNGLVCVVDMGNSSVQVF